MDEHADVVPRRPASLSWSVALWLWVAAAFFVLGFLSLSAADLPYRAGIGVWIALAVVFLRSGRRGARYVLTATAVPLAFGMVLGVGELGEHEGIGPLVFGLLLLVFPLVAAVVLMWLPATGRYFRQLREHAARLSTG
jgi:hypothetical protein